MCMYIVDMHALTARIKICNLASRPIAIKQYTCTMYICCLCGVNICLCLDMNAQMGRDVLIACDIIMCMVITAHVCTSASLCKT